MIVCVCVMRVCVMCVRERGSEDGPPLWVGGDVLAGDVPAIDCVCVCVCV